MSEEIKAFEIYKQVMKELKTVIHANDLRDQFAMAAMQGMMSYRGEYKCDLVSMAAYKLADAMIKEREKLKGI